ncbi:hypothetical protein TKK_0008136 [Trichogramma kaykai]
MFSIQTGSESLSLEDISDQLEKLRVKIEKVERVPDQVERLRARMEEMANIFDHAMDNIELMQNKTLEMMQTLDYLVEKVDNTNRVVLDLSLNRRLEAEGVQVNVPIAPPTRRNVPIETLLSSTIAPVENKTHKLNDSIEPIENF